jgi:hypothetical protein
MKINDIICEKLENLSVLGPLVDIVKQKSYRGGISPIESKFSSDAIWSGIGPNSEIIDAGILKTGFSDIRQTYRKVAEIKPVGFALAIENDVIAFALLDIDNIRKTTFPFIMAYDIEKFKDVVDMKIQPSSSYTKERYGKTGEYRGTITTVDDFGKTLRIFIDIADKIGTSVSIKIVGYDNTSYEKRIQRSRLRNSPELKSLNQRLAIYKNSKQPTANTIHDFIEMITNKSTSKIRFDNNTYLSKGHTYNKIDPVALLNGSKFSIDYVSAEPDNYQSLTISYAYLRSNQTIVPITASWNDGKKRNTEILNDSAWLETNYGVEPNKNNIIKNLLIQVKANPKNVEILNTINVLTRLGYDWKELDVIKQSVLSEINEVK